MRRRRLPPRVRLALLAGIRANRPALEVALAALRKESVDEIVDLGDAAGPGPHPAEVAALLAKRRIEGVLGAFEATAFADAHVPREFFPNDAAREAYDAAIAYARGRIPSADAKRLAARPPTRRFVADGRRILLAHGSSASPFERIPRSESDARLARHLAAARADVLVVQGSPAGARTVAEGCVVWAGSVGRSAEAPGAGEATWCILDTTDLTVATRSAAYDATEVERDTLKSGVPDCAV